MGTVTIKGADRVSVRVLPDGTMYRADVPLDHAIRIRTIQEAAKALGMSREEFINERDRLRRK